VDRAAFLLAAPQSRLYPARERPRLPVARTGGLSMGDITLTPMMIQSLIALLAGILILVVPRVLNYVVAIYLIVIGLLGLFG
jgi:hypothetical protein